MALIEFLDKIAHNFLTQDEKLNLSILTMFLDQGY